MEGDNKPKLTLGHILDYLEAGEEDLKSNSRRCLTEGDAIVNSHHLIHVGLKDPGARNDGAVQVFALCLQTSNLGEKPHEIVAIINVDGSIQGARCSCKAGLSGRCKHVVGVLLYANSHTISRLDATSCTDMSMKWKKKDGKALYEGRPITDMCHVPALEPVTVEKRGAVFQEMLQVMPDCMLANHLAHAQTAVSLRGPSVSDDSVFNVIIDKSMQLDPHLLAELAPPALRGAVAASYKQLCVTGQDAVTIIKERQESPRWVMEREQRVTGSSCYGLYTYARGRGLEGWEAKLKTMAKPFSGNQATAYGKRSEKQALDMYKEHEEGNGTKAIQCGLVVPPNCPWVGMSPDAVLLKGGEPHRLVEIKSPTAGAKLSAAELLVQGKVQYVVFDGENAYLKQKHPYYGQVQLGMAVLSVSMCDFVIYGKDSLAIIKVPRDDAFIAEMLRVLHAVYFRVLLPHHTAKSAQ